MESILMFWSNEKIQKKREYFKTERTEKRGKFTEFVVRTYYCIYKACSINNGRSCLASDVSANKIKFIIYEGFYEGTPDHDNRSVIEDCKNHLKHMNYIKFRNENEKWMIYINRPLDFLLDNEHESYMRKYNIVNPVESLDNILRNPSNN